MSSPHADRRCEKGLGKVRKELASHFYQLLSGAAATGEHLTRIGQAPGSECWWCGSGERQTRYYPFVKCRRWIPEIRRIWERIEKGCEWEIPRALSVRLFFGDERATPALLEFLDGAGVGLMPGLALLGEKRDEEELGEIELCIYGPRPGGGAGTGIVERRAGRVRPGLHLTNFSFVISFFPFVCRSREEGRRRGHPTMTAEARPGSEKVS